MKRKILQKGLESLVSESDSFSYLIDEEELYDEMLHILPVNLTYSAFKLEALFGVLMKFDPYSIRITRP